MSPSNCSYEISPAARHTAWLIRRNFDLLELGTVEATENNVAILIDVATQMFRVPAVLNHLLAVAPWWDVEALEENVGRLAEAVRAVELLRERLPAYRNQRQRPGNGEMLEFCKHYSTSAPALHAARSLMQQFQVVRKTTIQPTERNVAILVDVGTQIFRVESAVDALVRRFAWNDPLKTRQDLNDIRKALRLVELVRNRLPQYTLQSVRVTLREKREVEVKLTKAQLQESRKLASRVAAARTVEEQQAVLQHAGLVTAQS